MPRVSVVMPAYNAEKYIGEAIDSILNQTFTDFEFIIINDGSTDRTKEIILEYDDPRIVLLENEKNSGIVVTLNKGLDAAKGEYIARMDSDDIAVRERLQIQVKYMDKHSEIGVLGTGIRIFGDYIEPYDRAFTTNPDQLKAELIFNSCVAHPTVMIRKVVLVSEHFRYDKHYSGAEDYALWWGLSQKAKIATVPDILHHYRIHRNQITQDKSEKYQKMMYELMECRLHDMQIEASEDEEQALFMYCMGKFQEYSASNFSAFLDALSKILNVNKKTHMFQEKSLHRIVELSVIAALNNSDLSKDERKKEYKKAVSKGIFTPLMRLKVACRHIF